MFIEHVHRDSRVQSASLRTRRIPYKLVSFYWPCDFAAAENTTSFRCRGGIAGVRQPLAQTRATSEIEMPLLCLLHYVLGGVCGPHVLSNAPRDKRESIELISLNPHRSPMFVWWGVAHHIGGMYSPPPPRYSPQPPELPRKR